MTVFFVLALLACSAFAAPPAWLSPAPPAPPAAAPPAYSPPPALRARVVERVRLDTVFVVDTVVRVDTVRPAPPAYFDYVVYYEAVDKKIAASAGFEWLWEKTAQRTALQSSDTTLLSLGKENLRSLGYTYNDRGDRTENIEKIIEGLDLRVSGSSVSVTYRVDASLLSLNGRLDASGLLQLSSDFARRRYFLRFVPLDFLFGSEAFTLFLRVEKRGAR